MAKKRDTGQYQYENLIVPQTNLNGTSKKELLAQYADAVRSVRAAYEALRLVWPHGRDYQTMNPEAHPNAARQHDDRLQRLASVLNELEALYEGIYKQ